MDASAIRVHDEPLRRDHFERASDAIGDERGRFDVLRLDVDDAKAERERRLVLPEELDVLFAAAREFERKRVDLRVENRREQIFVAAFERRLAVPVAVTDMER